METEIAKESVSLRSDSRTSGVWRILGKKVPRSEMVFICQMILIYVVVAVSLFNLSKDNGPSHLWVALLSSAIGYTLPNPSIDLSTKISQ
jgi:hypothetical protein